MHRHTYSSAGTWPNHLRKYHRARYHLAQLRDQIKRWIDSDNHRVRFEVHPSAPHLLLIKASAERIPEDPFSLMIGDVAQNYRACLDYIAYELGARHPRKFTPEAQRRSMFPVIGCVSKAGRPQKGSDAFRSFRSDSLRAVDRRAQTILKRVQPYYRRSAFKRHWLWRLEDLATRDKHRLLHLAVAYPREWTLSPYPRAGHVIRWKNAKLVKFLTRGPSIGSDTVIGRMITRPAGEDITLQVVPAMAFADGPRGETDVLETFEAIDCGIFLLIEQLRRAQCL